MPQFCPCKPYESPVLTLSLTEPEFAAVDATFCSSHATYQIGLHSDLSLSLEVHLPRFCSQHGKLSHAALC